eukprot:3850226-Karenia_brevis.AAC.1
MQQKLDALDNRQSMAAARVQAVESTVASDNQHTYVDIDWDFVPDQTKVHIGVQALVKKQDMLKLLQDIWGPHFQPGDFAVWGAEDMVAKVFTVHFQGNTGRAARLAKRAMGLQRRPDGTWIDRYVATTLGDTTKVFFNPDKSPKQRR